MKDLDSHDSARGPGRPADLARGEARAALLRAARDVMEAKGLPRVTAREVAERAHLNPGLVGYYFGNKDGLLRAVVDEIASEAEARRARQNRAGGGPRERLRRHIKSAVENYRADPYAPRLITEQVLFGDDDFSEHFVDAFARAHVEDLQEILAEGRRSGDFRDLEMDLVIPAITGATIFYFIASSVFQKVFGGDTPTAERMERLGDAVADLVLEGVRAPDAPR